MGLRIIGSFFLQSEAVFRGYIAGDAKGLFQDGSRSSFDQLGIAAQAEAYITNSDGVDEIGWDGSANKIEAIMTQKWIATNGEIFNGEIDELMIYNRALTDAEISQIYNSYKP